MSIRHGTLYVDGNKVENTGSIGICYYCKKDSSKCGAFDDDSITTIHAYGIPAVAKWKDIALASQICSCPIGEFQYNSSKQKENSHLNGGTKVK